MSGSQQGEPMTAARAHFHRFTADDPLALARDIAAAQDDLAALRAGGDEGKVLDAIAPLGSLLTTARREEEAVALLEAAHARGERCRGIVASGGHLASQLVDALGAHRLAVTREVAPLCPRGTVAGGPWSGLSVITKGGLIGADGTLAALVDDLWKET